MGLARQNNGTVTSAIATELGVAHRGLSEAVAEQGSAIRGGDAMGTINGDADQGNGDGVLTALEESDSRETDIEAVRKGLEAIDRGEVRDAFDSIDELRSKYDL